MEVGWPSRGGPTGGGNPPEPQEGQGEPPSVAGAEAGVRREVGEHGPSGSALNVMEGKSEGCVPWLAVC